MIRIFSFLFLSILCLSASAQNIEVTESQEKINGSLHNVLTFSVDEGDRSVFEKEWKKLMRSYKGKSERGSEIIFINPAIPVLNSDTLVVYAMVHTKNKGVDFIAAFEVRNGFVSSKTHPAEFQTAKKLLYDFAIETTKEIIRDQIKEQEKELSKQQKELKNLEKERANLEDEIVKYEKAIEQAKADIEKNLKDQEATKELIVKQKTIVEESEKRLKKVK